MKFLALCLLLLGCSLAFKLPSDPDQKFTICGSHLIKAVANVCTPSGYETPCFHTKNEDEGKTKDVGIHGICCGDKSCSVNVLRRYCCDETELENHMQVFGK